MPGTVRGTGNTIGRKEKTAPALMELMSNYTSKCQLTFEVNATKEKNRAWGRRVLMKPRPH